MKANNCYRIFALVTSMKFALSHLSKSTNKYMAFRCIVRERQFSAGIMLAQFVCLVFGKFYLLHVLLKRSVVF